MEIVIVVAVIAGVLSMLGLGNDVQDTEWGKYQETPAAKERSNALMVIVVLLILLAFWLLVTGAGLSVG